MQTQTWNLDEITRDWDIYVAEPIGRMEKLKYLFWTKLNYPGILTPKCRSRKVNKLKYLRPGLLYTLRPKEHNDSMKSGFYKLFGKTIKEVRKK